MKQLPKDTKKKGKETSSSFFFWLGIEIKKLENERTEERKKTCQWYIGTANARMTDILHFFFLFARMEYERKSKIRWWWKERKEQTLFFSLLSGWTEQIDKEYQRQCYKEERKEQLKKANNQSFFFFLGFVWDWIQIERCNGWSSNTETQKRQIKNSNSKIYFLQFSAQQIEDQWNQY